MSSNFSQTAAYIWTLADLLRGDFKQSQYGRIILPFTILRRLECVLEGTKDRVLAQVERLKAMPDLDGSARDKFLMKASGHDFFNTSQMSLATMGTSNIRVNLNSYLESFSPSAREIFEHFRFDEFVTKLHEANLLFKVIKKVRTMDLSPKAISNHDMGLVFEELIRRFAESSNETAGEHFTPRDIVHLTTSLVFFEDNDALSGSGIVRTIYDPTAGTGGFLSSGMEYVHALNPKAVMRAYGQELNPESYAICKGDMLIKGQDVSRIKLGNTLRDDLLPGERFDYMLSNPPFGVDWKKVEGVVKGEHKVKGFAGRFGPGLPRVSDGSLLFLMHLLSKMRPFDSTDPAKPGGRIGIILNGSPLFTGGAGSGESEIRRHILESDLLEAIVALPTDMFYNTGIATYVWILSNKKSEERKGKVQLINGVHLYQKMRKSLGSKRQVLGEEHIKLITETFGSFDAVESYPLDDPQEETSSRGQPAKGRPSKKKAETRTFAAKIFESHAFGYRRIRIERPLRLSVQFTQEHIDKLRFATGRLGPAMEALYERFGEEWAVDWPEDGDPYGVFDSEAEDRARAYLKAEFKELKEGYKKDLLKPQLWRAQRALLEAGQRLMASIGGAQFDDFNEFEKAFKKAMKGLGIKLSAKEKKQLVDVISWTNPEAEPVVKKVVKGAAKPMYGRFEYKGKVVMFQPDSSLRDHEDVPLTKATALGAGVDGVNEAYFNKEVAPHVGDAWIDGEYKDGKDGGIGVVGYEIPFNRHFYEYEPPRDLAEIDAELEVLSGEIMEMLRGMRG